MYKSWMPAERSLLLGLGLATCSRSRVCLRRLHKGVRCSMLALLMQLC